MSTGAGCGDRHAREGPDTSRPAGHVVPRRLSRPSRTTRPSSSTSAGDAEDGGVLAAGPRGRRPGPQGRPRRCPGSPSHDRAVHDARPGRRPQAGRPPAAAPPRRRPDRAGPFRRPCRRARSAPPRRRRAATSGCRSSPASTSRTTASSSPSARTNPADPGVDRESGHPDHPRPDGGVDLVRLEEAAVLEGVEARLDRVLHDLGHRAVDRDPPTRGVHPPGRLGEGLGGVRARDPRLPEREVADHLGPGATAGAQLRDRGVRQVRRRRPRGRIRAGSGRAVRGTARRSGSRGMPSVGTHVRSLPSSGLPGSRTRQTPASRCSRPLASARSRGGGVVRCRATRATGGRARRPGPAPGTRPRAGSARRRPE